MMQYFRLTDEVEIPGRWHLGQVFDGDRSRDDFLAGKRLAEPNALSVEISHTGLSLNFCLTSFAVPVAVTALGEAILRCAGSDLQLFTLRILPGLNHDVLNATRSIVCLDEQRSEFMKWLPGDHRPDLVGQYRMVPRLIVDPTRVPADAHFFRIAGWRVALIVSQSVKDAMETQGCFGAKFCSVSLS
jgi:hypothetical protein